MAKKRYRKWYHLPLQPPIQVLRDDPVDGDHLIFDTDANSYESAQPESEVVDYIDFSAVGAAIAARRLTWNPVTGTLEVGLAGGVSAVQLGLERVVSATNDTGGDIADTTAVYISGADGTVLEITTAAVGAFATAGAIGLCTEDIDDGATGFVTTYGPVTGIDTSGFVDGDKLYLGAAGALTDTRPGAGAATGLIVEMGFVVFADAAGVVYLDPHILPRLQDLSDVLVAAPDDGDVPTWVDANSRFEFLTPAEVLAKEVSWAFTSPAGTTGVLHFGGYHDFAAANNDFSPAINFGTANAAKAAHLALVLGELTVDEVTVTVTGVSITDAGVRTPGDTEDIVIPDATAANAYFETDKKWLGTVAIETTVGTAKQCNYGFAKYWDNNNTDFTVVGLEVTWVAGANDANPNIELLLHTAVGWTYNAGAAPTSPAPIAAMATDHGADKKLVNGGDGAWKRDNLSTDVDGSASEGTIWVVTTTANKAFELGNILMRVVPR